MVNLKDYIKSAFNSNEKWMIKNHPDIHSDILNYCSNINDLSFKQKLWHYQNQIPYKITCKNKNCDNLVTFKGRWTQGYRTYCCQKCAIPDVEYKKSLLNYSRKAKLSKEEKDIISKQKEIDRNIREEKQHNNKIKRDQESNRLKNISINEYLDLVENNNANGVYTKEKYLNKNMPHILELLNSKIKIDSSIDEKAYMVKQNILERPKCKCGNDVKFINKVKGYAICCSKNCSAKYGNEKARETLFKKTGSRHHSGLQHNIDRRIDRKIRKIKDHIKNDELFLEYDKNTHIMKIKCDKCDEIHEICEPVISQRIQLGLDWRNCITSATGISNGEIEVKEYIQSIYKGEIISNNRQILYKNEIDIYIPELKLGIEYNGVYFHSSIFKDKDYHHNKWKLAYENNIKLVQIYEDEWLYKKDIVKSRLQNLISPQLNTKIYARKCDIREVEFSTVKQFLNDNHLQGSINSSINYGLFYNNELLSLMTFGRPRKAIKYKNSDAYELYRFCSKINYSVIGGASKLFKYFIKTNIEINEVYSFSALEWPGGVYEKLGMTLKSISKFSYWYLDKDIRISRHRFNKQNLIKMGYDPNKSENEIVKELKILKIYGPGNKTFIWTRICNI